MPIIELISPQQEASRNSHELAFTLSPGNHGYWKTMLEPFLVTNNLFGYVDEFIPCLTVTINITSKETTSTETTSAVTVNPKYTT